MKRYHQSHASRMDESLGERRGKESGMKQSYKSRRHESQGMKGHKSSHNHEHMEDHPSNHMGHGEFANMPRQEEFHKYPGEAYGYGTYNDTITGIDEVQEESYKKVERHPSRQKG